MTCFLLDGPLMLAPERRVEAVTVMAGLLLDAEAYADRGDSVRLLMRRDFSTVEIMLLVDDARQVAMQDVVAREMSAG